MFPHERSLVKEMKGKPFVLLGVNVDDPRGLETVKEWQQDGNVTWRSWRDGPAGPIGRQWQIDGYPTLFLIDAKGVIRARVNIPRRDFWEQVNKLVAETESGAS